MALLLSETGSDASTNSLPRADSLVDEPGAFEGPEKTLEVCFLPGAGDIRGCRGLTRAQLDCILEEARCTILSRMSNAHLDAYVLRESSLFVYAHKVVVKTCGRTTLLRCLRRLVQEATSTLGLQLEWVGYSRKNYCFPDDQVAPHGCFEDELRYLKAHQGDAEKVFDGSGYVLGPLTGDHWFVYVSDQCERPASSATERTVNVMMFDLPEDVRRHFHLQGDEDSDLRAAGRAMTQRSGLKALIPGKVDDHAFAPCGYSLNALSFESYTTVHVTPEASCSYASFETITALKSFGSLVKNVLAVFRPKRVVLTLFADEAGLRELPRSALFAGQPRLDVSGSTYVRENLSSTQVEHDCGCMMANYTLKRPGASRTATPSSPLRPRIGSLQ